VHIIVTGGAGFIGSNFISYLSKYHSSEIHKISVIDKITYAGKWRNIPAMQSGLVETFELDINEISKLSDLVEQADYIVNFAAESHVDRSIDSDKIFIESNILGVHSILRTILKVNPSIRFLQVSTDEVYGSINTGSWSEDSPLEPNSPYAASKASADLLVRSYFKTHGLDVVTTRCSNNYGPNQLTEKFIPKIITNALMGIQIPVYGSGQNIRDWIFVEDHCKAIYKCLVKGSAGDVYNISGNNEINNLDIVLRIRSIMDFDPSLLVFVPDRKGHDFRYSLTGEKIASELGFNPEVNFMQGLTNTIDWYESNTWFWENE
jgi:dTDP-glucose 4,6-dehydratase